jgi:hypothetical protein
MFAFSQGGTTASAANVSHLTSGIAGPTNLNTTAFSMASFSAYAGITGQTITSTKTIILSLRNNSTFRNRDNRQDVLLNELSVYYSSTTSACMIVGLLNPTFASVANPGLVWTGADANGNSCCSVSTTATSVTGGSQMLTFPVFGSAQVSPLVISALNKILKPGDVITFAIFNIFGTTVTAVECDIALTWSENM